ncbi:hypothetical protein CCOS865_01184 [Pseudomonas reidholzensis]|uniref:Uncharacterized protein n=1 Tax=Pseudomonas reidholzensis TaxID=1785162 RepID=A0A383RQL6_9PSED|nr:hypothetical protein CCOS865_01184 [Pseudomonas reidholzensis]
MLAVPVDFSLRDHWAVFIKLSLNCGSALE